jgi:hypothetical protein
VLQGQEKARGIFTGTAERGINADAFQRFYDCLVYPHRSRHPLYT